MFIYFNGNWTITSGEKWPMRSKVSLVENGDAPQGSKCIGLVCIIVILCQEIKAIKLYSVVSAQNRLSYATICHWILIYTHSLCDWVPQVGWTCGTIERYRAIS